MSNLVTDEDIRRARTDPTFRQQMLAENLARLLEALKRTRRQGNEDPKIADQLREGVDLAVKLADRLQQYDNPNPRSA